MPGVFAAGLVKQLNRPMITIIGRFCDMYRFGKGFLVKVSGLQMLNTPRARCESKLHDANGCIEARPYVCLTNWMGK